MRALLANETPTEAVRGSMGGRNVISSASATSNACSNDNRVAGQLATDQTPSSADDSFDAAENDRQIARLYRELDASISANCAPTHQAPYSVERADARTGVTS